MFDLAIIGGGPAGASAAITAARAGARVLLLERGRYPRNRVCGEFVSAEALSLLESLAGESHRALLREALRIPELRLFSDGRVISGRLNPAGASISRFDLDNTLWQAARAARVDGRTEVTVQSIEGHGPFRIATRDALFESKVVVKACGRWSNLSTRLTDSQTAKKWIGVKAHYTEEKPSKSVDLYFFSGGYCGVQPVSLDGSREIVLVNVCAKVRADVASNLDEVFACHPDLLKRSMKWRRVMEPLATSPLIFRKPTPLEGNVLLVGDAAGFVDPFVGDGISLALRSGAFCATALQPFFAGTISLETAAQMYSAHYQRELLPVFAMSSKIRQIFFGLPGAIRALLLSGIARNPHFVQYLVRRTR